MTQASKDLSGNELADKLKEDAKAEAIQATSIQEQVAKAEASASARSEYDSGDSVNGEEVRTIAE